MGWLPIESAPRDGTRLLLFFPTASEPIQIGKWEHSEHFTNGLKTWDHAAWRVPSAFYAVDHGEPSHWMDLPASLESRDG